MPIFFLSGALFPLTNLPKLLSVATSLDPLTCGIDGLRGALIGLTHYGFVTNVSVLSLGRCSSSQLARISSRASVFS